MQSTAILAGLIVAGYVPVVVLLGMIAHAVGAL